MIEEGKKAPAFNLPDHEGKKHSLKEFLGNDIVLYFYPKDMTSGCTKEACDFRDTMPKFDKLNAVVIGISGDSPESHQKFITENDLNFLLLSDVNKEVLEKYDVWKEKSMYGRKYMGIERTTVVIDKEGKIKKIFPKVKVPGHAEEVLKVLIG
ncbi:MAG: thioredoxin-dependent thiol peroxidase [Ignavibacteriaceae bacterium]|jgi:peroxiredoxin Q/BCP|nr:thioredoxin-dependent thiol peroxidase [Ignavibacteriaceae bacterium]